MSYYNQGLAVGSGGLQGGSAPFRGGGRKKNMGKKYCNAAAVSPWIAHVRQVASEQGINYAQALSDPMTRTSYYTSQGKLVPPLKARSNFPCSGERAAPLTPTPRLQRTLIAAEEKKSKKRPLSEKSEEDQNKALKKALIKLEARKRKLEDVGE